MKKSVFMMSQTALDESTLQLAEIMHVYEGILTFTQIFNELIDLCYSFFS